MNKKILAFIYNKETNKFLLLNMTKHIDHSPKGGWFTVTGEIENNETPKDAIIREVKEETNLEVSEVFDLKWGSVYSWSGEDHSENNFLTFVKKREVILNEEHVAFEWLNLDEFIKKINWDLNKEELKKVLEKAIKKELFFKKEKIDDFREKY